MVFKSLSIKIKINNINTTEIITVVSRTNRGKDVKK